MTDLHFKIPRQLIINANQRLHWAAKARSTAALRALGRYQGRRHQAMDRAHLTVRVGWPDKRRRDVANISPTIKALIDGIVDAGLLPDDDDAHLVGPDLRPHVAGMKGHVVLDFDFEEIS